MPPVGRASREELEPLRDGVMEVTERKEVPVIKKESHVVEEVSLNREVGVRDETVSDTVRHTEADIEDLKDHRKV